MDRIQKAKAKMDKRKEANLKKAKKILAKDFSKSAKNYTFYVNNNYDSPYTQGEWIELYEKALAQNNPMYLAPIYNAIVVAPEGHYIRRGLEWVKNNYIPFSPGRNDRITSTYEVEPYIYKETVCTQTTRPQTAKSTTQADPNRLSSLEKDEINKAKRKYEQAMAYASRDPSDEIRANMEKRAYANYLSVLAKYAGRK